MFYIIDEFIDFVNGKKFVDRVCKINIFIMFIYYLCLKFNIIFMGND